MPPQRKNVWIGEPIRRLIDTTRPGNFSGAVNTAIGRYQDILSRSLPDLSTEEWCLIFDSLNGTWFDELTTANLWLSIADANRHHGLGDKWGVNVESLEALEARLQALSYAECVAIVEMTERFWSRTGQGGSYEAIIRAMSDEMRGKSRGPGSLQPE